MDDERLERIREICLALPEATAATDVHTAFRVRDKTFVWYLVNHHGDGRVAINCKAPPGEQALRVGSDPERFFVPPYLGPRGWIGLRLDVGPVDWDEVAEVVEESYRMTAPKRLTAQLDR
jgi:predicted DNA-binding protein (MmcQ/YjbR family)